MKNPFDGLISSLEPRYRCLDNLFEHDQHSSRPKLGLYGNMFIEDLSMRAFPYTADSENDFHVRIRTEEEQIRQHVTNAIPRIYMPGGDLNQAIRRYAQDSVRLLAREPLFLEIEYFYPSRDDSEAPVAFRINWPYPGQIVRTFGGYIYTLPMEDSSSTYYREKLSQESVTAITLPRGVRRCLRRALRSLATLDSHHNVISDFTSGKFGQNTGFSVGEYKTQFDSTALRTLKFTGWTARGLFSEPLLQPAAAWRALQFSRLAMMLRDHSMRGLQEAVEKAGKKMGFTAYIEITGQLTQFHLDQMEIDLQRGVRPLGEFFMPSPPSGACILIMDVVGAKASENDVAHLEQTNPCQLGVA